MSGALSDREQRVLRYRYGFHDGQMHDVRDTAQRYGVTPARIDQIELGALRRLDWECFYGQERVLRALAQALRLCCVTQISSANMRVGGTNR